MRITLISTSTYPSDQGIRTVSSSLKKAGHEVKLVFMTLSENYFRNYTKKELIQLARICKNSGLIGVNAYASTSKRAERIIRFLNQLKIPIIYGGVHPTISPNDAIKHANLICVGEGEEAVVELANALEKNKPINKIKNLWIKNQKQDKETIIKNQKQDKETIIKNQKQDTETIIKNQKQDKETIIKNQKQDTETIIKNPVRNLVDNIDSLPFPDYNLEYHYILESGKLRKFQEKDLGGQIFFLTGRGCPYGCDYCSNSLFNELYKGKRKKILRWHSPEYIIDGILYLKNKFPSLNSFDIRDDTFSFRSLEDIKKFCELYKEKVKMRFKCLGDPKTIDNEKIKLLVEAGCTDIIVGIQGSERVNLEIYHRNQTDANILRAGKILSKYKDKLTVMYDIITSNPYESPEDIINMIKLLQKLSKPYYLSVNNLVFFPGSALYTRAKKDGIIKTEKDSAADLNYWDRAKHIKLKKKNIYLNLILNLMRGVVTDKKYGVFPAPLLKYLIKEKRIKRNLKNPAFSYLILNFVSISDLIREKLAKPFFRSLPLSFRVWYDKVRYR